MTKSKKTSMVLRVLLMISGLAASHLVASSGDLCFTLSYIYDSTRCVLSPYNIGNWDLVSIRMKGQYFVFAGCLFVILAGGILCFLASGERHLALEKFVLLTVILTAMAAGAIESWYAAGFGECFGRYFDMFADVWCRANNWIAGAILLFVSGILGIADIVTVSMSPDDRKAFRSAYTITNPEPIATTSGGISAPRSRFYMRTESWPKIYANT